MESSSQPFSAHSQVVSQESSCLIQAYQTVIARYFTCVWGMPRGMSTMAQLSTAQESAGSGEGWGRPGRTRQFNCETIPFSIIWQPAVPSAGI